MFRSLFGKGTYLQSENDELKNNCLDTKDKCERSSIEKVEEEWVWAEGYKGTLKNMTCRGFKYEIGKQYDIADDVEECKNGFHLCLKLEDVFDWYQIEHGNRFFKVKALVRKDDVSNYGSIQYSAFNGIAHINKIVAKSIVFVEEITYSNGLKQHVDYRHPFIENEEEYLQLTDVNYECLEKLHFIKNLLALGYSELMCNIIYEEKSRNLSKTLKLQEL